MKKFRRVLWAVFHSRRQNFPLIPKRKKIENYKTIEMKMKIPTGKTQTAKTYHINQFLQAPQSSLYARKKSNKLFSFPFRCSFAVCWFLSQIAEHAIRLDGTNSASSDLLTSSTSSRLVESLITFESPENFSPTRDLSTTMSSLERAPLISVVTSRYGNLRQSFLRWKKISGESQNLSSSFTRIDSFTFK